jgi:transcriptional regulator with XRE-family HTH domain
MNQSISYNSLVGYVLEKIRSDLGMDQRSAAAKAKISQPVLSRLEQGKAAITVDQLYILSKVLHTTPDLIMKEVQNAAEKFEEDKNVDVVTTKEIGTTNKVIAGVAIGAVLGLLINRR